MHVDNCSIVDSILANFVNPAPIEAIRPNITTMFVRLSCIFFNHFLTPVILKVIFFCYTLFRLIF
jgi:hypothetical protein